MLFLLLAFWFSPCGCKDRKSEASSPTPNTTSPAGDDSTGGGTIDVSASASTSDASLRPRDDLPGLSNFAKVSDVLYRGAQPTAEGFRTLKGMGIKTVINLRLTHSDRALLAGTGLQYAHIAAAAWHPEDEDIVRALRIIRDSAHQPVFVHCQHGADRTGVTIAAYRIVEQGWSIGDAANELPNFRFHPIWSDILAYLQKFDRSKLERRLAAMAPVELETIP